MTPKEKEFVLLWILLTFAAAREPHYSVAQTGADAGAILDLIAGKVKPGWMWTDRGGLMKMLGNMITQPQGFSKELQAVFNLPPDGIPWPSGGPVHPTPADLATALGILP
jgi:hypothetical protein